MLRSGLKLWVMRGAGTLVVLAVVGISLCVGRSEATPTYRVAAVAAMAEKNGRITFVRLVGAENLVAEVFRVDVVFGWKHRTSPATRPRTTGQSSRPTGRPILFGSSRDNSGSIWAMNADGTHQRRPHDRPEPRMGPERKKDRLHAR